MREKLKRKDDNNLNEIKVLLKISKLEFLKSY